VLGFSVDALAVAVGVVVGPPAREHANQGSGAIEHARPAAHGEGVAAQGERVAAPRPRIDDPSPAVHLHRQARGIPDHGHGLVRLDRDVSQHGRLLDGRRSLEPDQREIHVAGRVRG